MNRLGRVGKLALLSGMSLAASLFVSELALRWTGFSFHLRPERIDFGWPRSLASLGDEYRSDPELLWVRANYEQTLARARAERPAIAFLGDSCTDFGRYPDLLLQNLSRKRPGIRWTGANLGTAGWSSFQGLRQLQRDALPLRPRIITVYYGWNDHWIGFGLPDEEVADLLHRTGSGWQDLRLVQLGEKAWIGARRSDDSHRVPLPEFRRNLHEIVRLARGAGSEPVLITAPTSHQRGREPQFLAGRWLKRLEDLVPLHQQYVEAVRDVGRQDGAVVCDLAGELATLRPENRNALFLKDGIHLNLRGSHKAARLLADCLDSSGVLDRAGNL